MKKVCEVISQKAFNCIQNVIDTANYYICTNVTVRHCDDGKSVDSNTSLQESAPSPAKVDEEFKLFVENLDLPEQNCRILNNLSIEKKWTILVERKNHQNVNPKSSETYVSLLNNEIQMSNNRTIKYASLEIVTALEALLVSIRTQPQSYIQEFIEVGGLECLSNLLGVLKCNLSADDAISLTLNIIKSLLNSQIGQNAVLRYEKLLCTLALLAGIVVGKSKILVLQILGGLCLVQDGREKILASFTETQSVALEKTCFQRVIWQLTEKFYPEKVDVSIKIATMSFINVLLNSGEAKNKLEERLRLRNHFSCLGIEKIITYLRSYEHSVLQDHLDLFEMMRLEDDQEYAKKHDQPQIDMTQPAAIVGSLETRLQYNDESFYSFLSLLQNLTHIQADKQGQFVWKLCNIFVENVVSEVNADLSMADKQSVSTELQRALHKIHSDNDYQKLLKEYERVTQRLNEVETNLNDMKKEKTVIVKNCVQNTTESLPNLASAAQNSEGVACAKLAIVHPLKVTVHSSVPPAPPPLPAKFSPVPAVKSFTKSSPALKGLNWVIVPDTELDGTIWCECSAEEFHKLLDVDLLDKNFSILTKSKRDSLAEINNKHVSLLEPRRAQNCHILLSKLKMTNEEIHKLVTTLDPNSVIPKDMIEQMLKFVPTKEEIQKLIEAEKITSLNQVDQFFLLTSRIPRYEQRLKCLWLTKVFSEKASEIKFQAEAVIKASKILRESKRIRKLMQIILAIGNHLNEGKRNGAARAFHVSSLTNLIDVKSSLKPEYTLMHYLVECCESKFPEIFRLKRELLTATEASKVSNEIETEMNALRNGIHMVETELNYKISSDIYFNSLMTAFLKENKTVLLDLQSILEEMDKIYKSCLKMFAVMNLIHPINPGEFFSIFSRFLNSLLNVRKCLKQEKENQDRRIETLSQIRMQRALSRETTIDSREKEKTDSLMNLSHKKDNLQDFEALISALQTGEVFFDDLHRLRTSFRRTPARKNKTTKIFDRSKESRER